MNNNRYIDIDTDTRVGYNFLKSKYYVTNKGTTTYRSTIEEIQKVLHALEITDIEDSTLEEFYTSIENLTDIYYTWSDTGSYIHTIQFNDYKDFPLVLDCEKARIYIMNSTIVFNLTVNESARNVRVPYLCSWYLSKLGLNITREDMLTFYNLLYSFFTPTVYTLIEPQTEQQELTDLTYSDTFKLSNFSETSKIVYSGTQNPLNLTTYSNIGDITSIDSVTQTITTTTPITTLQVGDKINISNATTTIDETPYSADGTYTIFTLTNNQIVVEESIPVSYQFQYMKCSLVSSLSDIDEISRDNRTITLQHQVPNSIFTGDTIYIQGTTITTEHGEEISCNGIYTISSIHNKDIVVEEEIPTNYTGSTGQLYKLLPLGNITSISSNTIHLQDEITLTNLQGSTIQVLSPDNEVQSYIVSNAVTNTIQVTTTIENYTPDYPLLREPQPSSEVEINVLESLIEDVFPVGEFILDNFTQAQDYVFTVRPYGITPIPNYIAEQLYNKVPTTYPITTTVGITSMKLLGLYSRVYTELTT